MANERTLIAAHFAAEWHDYTLADVTISPITDANQFTYGAQDAGAQIGDWLIETNDGQAAEIVRIANGAVQSIHSNP